MKVAITGVAGFLGSHMADHFLAQGWEVSGVDNLLGGYKSNIPEGVEFFEVDATEPENLHKAFEGADIVLNTACTAYEGLSVFSPALIVRNTSLLVASVMSASVVNIGPDEETITINQLAEKLAGIIGFDLDPIYMPGRPQEVYRAECSSELARELLGYHTSTTLDEGLKELVAWIDSEGAKPFTYHLPLEFVTDKTPKTWSHRLM
jgi:nucleoside-diphosphate-sugar epimerase